MNMDNSTCIFSMLESYRTIYVAFTGSAVLVCISAVVQVCAMKLYKKLVYRLAMYQVLAATLLGLDEIVQIITIDYNFEARQTYPSRSYCLSIAYFTVYFECMKLCFISLVTFHLFCFVVFYKNFQKLEALYVTTSLLLPAFLAAIPLATHSYGLSGLWCWIDEWTNNCPWEKRLLAGISEQFALFYGPSIVVAVATSSAMIVILATLSWRARLTMNSAGNQQWKAIKQLLPLAAYPLTFCVFIILPFVYRVYSAKNSTSPNPMLAFAAALCVSGFSLFSGLAVVIHASVVYIYTKTRANARPVVGVQVHRYRAIVDVQNSNDNHEN